MGRQIEFHMLAEDCREFLTFLQARDPVIVVPYTSDSLQVRAIRSPCDEGGWYCLWNQSLLPDFQYRYIPESDRGPYYRTDDSLPVLEYSKPGPGEWKGRPALTRGRVWCSFEYKGKDLERWFNAIVRWIKKNYVRNPSFARGGYVGPAAYEWFKKGGVLLPVFVPPLTPAWISWLEAHDKARDAANSKSAEPLKSS